MNELSPVREANTKSKEWNYLHYWQVWHHNWDHSDFELIRRMIPLAGKTVLEVGCGDGRITFRLAPLCERIIGVDKEPRFIEVAQRNLSSTKMTNVQFKEMDAQSLDLPAESVDLVLFPWVLQMVPDPVAAVGEAHRALKPGGKLVVIGLRSNSDYDHVIDCFAKDQPTIDPVKCYQDPIAKSFGEIDQVLAPINGIPFPYFFESHPAAVDAFHFALDYWYKRPLSADDLQQLDLMLKDYAHGDKVRIIFPASVYVATKR